MRPDGKTKRANRLAAVPQADIVNDCNFVRSNIRWTSVRIGRASGVVVKKATEKQREKFVTPHDIRRTFAERVSRKLRLDEVQELLGHASIETTKRYYVGSNAERTGRRLWEAFREC